MNASDALTIATVVAMVVVYMTITTWLMVRYRSKTTSDYMVAARSVPAVVLGILMMWDFIGPKSTSGAAQTAFEPGMAASWAIAIGLPPFGIFPAAQTGD